MGLIEEAGSFGSEFSQQGSNIESEVKGKKKAASKGRKRKPAAKKRRASAKSSPKRKSGGSITGALDFG